MNVERELHEALARKQAPADLAGRVLARARQNSERPTARIVSGPAASAPRGTNIVMRWLAAAAVFAVAAGGAERYYTRQQEAAEAARVQRELRIALQITNDAIARVQSKLSPPVENSSR